MSSRLSRKLGARVLWEPEHWGRSILKARLSAADHGTSRMTDDGGGLISQWIGRVNALTLTATGTARPTWRATGAIPFPNLKFDGVANCMVNTAFSSILPVGSTPGWIMVIASFNTVAATGTILHYGGAGVNLRGMQKDGSDRYSITDGTTLFTHVAADPLVSNSIVGPRVLIAAWAGTAESGRLNGDYTNPQSVTIASLNTGTARLSIGANNNPAAGGFGSLELYEALVFAGTPTLADFQQAETWAYDRYNLAALLPIGHPGGAPTPFSETITRVYGCFVDGQSLSNGDGSLTPITVNPLDPGRAVSFSGGARVLGLPQGFAQVNTLLTPANLNSFIDLRERRDQIAGETLCSHASHRMLAGLQASDAVLFGCTGIGASDFSNLTANTAQESNFISCHWRGKRICLAEGLDFKVPAWMLIDGESEHNDPNYLDELIFLQARREALIQEITGDTAKIPIILTQVARIDGALSRIAQYDAWRLYPDRFILAGPDYNLPVQAYQTQGAFHFTNVSCARVGALMGRVWRTFVEGGTWNPLHVPEGSAVRTGNTIVIIYAGGVGDLVDEEVAISPLADGHKGITWQQTGGNTVAISSVAISDASARHVTIVLTGDPGTPDVEQLAIGHYSDHPEIPSPGGPILGPRCNFRDSDTATVDVTASGVTTTWPMYNYACMQVIDVVRVP